MGRGIGPSSPRAEHEDTHSGEQPTAIPAIQKPSGSAASSNFRVVQIELIMVGDRFGTFEFGDDGHFAPPFSSLPLDETDVGWRSHKRHGDHVDAVFDPESQILAILITVPRSLRKYPSLRWRNRWSHQFHNRLPLLGVGFALQKVGLNLPSVSSRSTRTTTSAMRRRMRVPGNSTPRSPRATITPSTTSRISSKTQGRLKPRRGPTSRPMQQPGPPHMEALDSWCWVASSTSSVTSR